jgi:hypothetical protein
LGLGRELSNIQDKIVCTDFELTFVKTIRNHFPRLRYSLILWKILWSAFPAFAFSGLLFARARLFPICFEDAPMLDYFDFDVEIYFVGWVGDAFGSIPCIKN